MKMAALREKKQLVLFRSRRTLGNRHGKHLYLYSRVEVKEEYRVVFREVTASS